ARLQRGTGGARPRHRHGGAGSPRVPRRPRRHTRQASRLPPGRHPRRRRRPRVGCRATTTPPRPPRAGRGAPPAPAAAPRPGTRPALAGWPARTGDWGRGQAGSCVTGPAPAGQGPCAKLRAMKADILPVARPVPFTRRARVARLFMLRAVLGLALVLPGAAGARPPAPADVVAEALQPLLAAEFALQSGRLDEAGRGYLEAARLTGDLDLARRATAIALLARDDQLAGEALDLWRGHGEGGIDLMAAEATVALRSGRQRAALRY